MSINGKKHHENDDQFQNDQEHTTDNQSTEEINANADAVADGTAQQAQAAGETEQLADALAEQKDKYIRLMAEFENYKRRTAK